jgi:predicted N-acetyltransferase YhbS
MFTIVEEAPGQSGAREALLDRVFGPARFAKTSERLREGRLPVLALSARESGTGRLIGTVRLWAVEVAGSHGVLLLGPLAVTPQRQDEGIGAALMRRALNCAAAGGHGAVLLVGDAPYYGRFGFAAALAHRLEMPGPVDRHRFLGHELRPRALAEANGLVRAAGAWQPPESGFERARGSAGGSQPRHAVVTQRPLI